MADERHKSRTDGQFVRVGELQRDEVVIFLDGKPLNALAGDTILTALMLKQHSVRKSEFGDGPRAGFCNMGACQDCWVVLEGGTRVRACSTYVAAGMRLCCEDDRWPL